MKELLLVPILSLATYLLYVYIKYGMTISISETYRELKIKEKFLFTVTLWAVAIPIIIVSIETVKDQSPVLFFIAGSLLMLVSASPTFWSGKMELTAHLIGSYGSIGIGIVACLDYFFNPITIYISGAYILLVVVQFFIKKLRLNNFIYWLEIGAIITVTWVLYVN